MLDGPIVPRDCYSNQLTPSSLSRIMSGHQWKDSMKHSARPSQDLSESTCHHLNMYALAASAAGVGMLALSQPSEAKIIYRSAHIHIGINSKVPFDVDRNGTADFIFSDRTSYYSPRATLSIIPAGNNQAWGHKFFSRGYASALVAGVKVGKSRHLFPGKKLMAKTSASYYS